MIKNVARITMVLLMAASLVSAAQITDDFESYGDTGYLHTGDTFGPWTVTGGSAIVQDTADGNAGLQLGYDGIGYHYAAIDVPSIDNSDLTLEFTIENQLTYAMAGGYDVYMYDSVTEKWASARLRALSTALYSDSGVVLTDSNGAWHYGPSGLALSSNSTGGSVIHDQIRIELTAGTGLSLYLNGVLAVTAADTTLDNIDHIQFESTYFDGSNGSIGWTTWNIDDVAITYEVPGLLEGDANRDGVVSAGDYASVQSNFGDSGDPGIPGDANGDGVVSAGDYASVQANFGSALATSVVPEPATMTLLGLSGLGVLIRRRRKA